MISNGWNFVFGAAAFAGVCDALVADDLDALPFFCVVREVWAEEHALQINTAMPRVQIVNFDVRVLGLIVLLCFIIASELCSASVSANEC
jgi:hypothetical protein